MEKNIFFLFFFFVSHFHNRFINLALLQTEAALIYDSIFVFAIGLQTLEQSHTLRLSNISCADEIPWDGGLSLINYMNTVSMQFASFFFFFEIFSTFCLL